MSIDYLEDLERSIDFGRDIYACPGVNMNEWHIADTLEELQKKAQRSANSKKMPVSIYRLVNKMDTTTGDSYLVVRKILEPGPRGEPHLSWSLVDTREAGDMMRDVSQGPTPYFGASEVEVFKPSGVA